MKIIKGLLVGLAAGVAVLAVSSCAYDPYYSGTSYSAGYGQGYGYGSSSFSTSVFVSTGNPRWGYDPYAGSYYDYTRRAYYDPYLYGYYPVGYRPRYVVGAPHPGGWTRGRSYCPPPTRIRNHTLNNYSNRAESYRSLGRDWSSDVRVNTTTDRRRDGYSGRESRQPGFDGSRGSTFPRRQESFPSRGGSFQRSGNDRDRGSFNRGQSGGRSFGSGNTSVMSPQPSIPSSRPSIRGGDSVNRLQERQVSPQVQLQPSPRVQRPAPPQPRMERPTPSRVPQAQPSSPRGNLDPRGNTGGGDPRSRGRGIRSLGEG